MLTFSRLISKLYKKTVDRQLLPIILLVPSQDPSAFSYLFVLDTSLPWARIRYKLFPVLIHRALCSRSLVFQNVLCVSLQYTSSRPCFLYVCSSPGIFGLVWCVNTLMSTCVQLFKKIIDFTCVFAYIYFYISQVCLAFLKVKGGHLIPWHWSNGHMWATCWCWNSNPGPLGEQPLFLTTEPSFCATSHLVSCLQFFGHP